jgi:hypothetical protein
MHSSKRLGLKKLLQPCAENTLRGILVTLCSMFQRDYLDVPNLVDGLRSDHVKDVIRNAFIQEKLAKPAGGVVTFERIDGLFANEEPDEMAHLNNVVQRLGKANLEDTVVRLCGVFQEFLEDSAGHHFGAIVCVNDVRGSAYGALTTEMHAVMLQQDADRRAFAVVQGACHNMEAGQHREARAGGRKQAWTGLLSVSADMLTLVASFLAREEVKSQRKWLAPTHERRLRHNYAQYSPCGNFVLMHSVDSPYGNLQLLHATSGRAKLPGALGGIACNISEDYASCCCFFPDGKYIVNASEDYSLKVWNAESGSFVRTLETDDTVLCVDVSHDSTRILGVSEVLEVTLWNANTGEVQHTMKLASSLLHTRSPCCKFSPDSTSFLVAEYQKLLLYNTTTHELQKTFTGHSAEITSCSFDLDGATILSGSYDLTLKLWCVTTGRLLRSLEGHTHLISACAFSPSGKSVVSASHDQTLRLWATSTGKQQLIVDAHHSQEARSISFSTNGKSILGSYADGTVKMWRHEDVLRVCVKSGGM